ncbi:MAG: ATP-binding protein [Clostridia bacterium]|nr:ATP-binding protein [Clostridia bacterium]
MSFNSKNYYELREAFEQKHLAAAERAEARRTALADKIDGLREIDGALSATAARIFGAAFAGKEGLADRIAKIKRETEELRAARVALLEAHGYPADYTDVHYDCEKCRDLGFVETKMCECFKRALVLRGYETSGLGALIGKQTFDNYSLDYFHGEDRERMRQNFTRIKSYAESFSRNSDSLLLMGGTGLGKTHLSSALAKVVIDRGFDVLYTSVLNMIAEFEKAKFRGEQDDTDRYFAAELLIMDDLGTELGGSFTESCLYNVIDTRICKGLPTVISTNLTAAQLSERYTGRLFSRLLGVYKPLLFCGKDVRFEKK